MNKSNPVLNKADREIESMRFHDIDYSDIPSITESRKETGRLHYKEFLDKLPPDILREMARRKMEEIKTPEPAGEERG
jgi:hypothetical protein